MGGGERPRAAPQPGPEPDPAAPLSEEEVEAKMAELRQQLAETPAELVVANHCFRLFELAALHLSLQPPQLPQAKLALDALGSVVEGLAGRLGEPEQQLRDGLAQLRMAYVQIKSATSPSDEGGA